MAKKEKGQKDEKIQDQEIAVEEQSTGENKIEEKKEPTPEEKLQAEKDRYLRLFAEFENYKKRTSRERIELFKTAGEEIVVSMLPVMDDFDRAIKELQANEKENAEELQGVTLIFNKFKNVLEQKGLQAVEAAAGDAFDAEVHEAITQIPAPSDEMKGKLIDVVEKGYKLGDKVIRFPKVVVGK